MSILDPEKTVSEKQRANLAAALLLLTTLAMFSQLADKTKTLDLSELADSQILPVDDRYEGGKSVSALERSPTDDKIILNCDIVKSEVSWPYCSVSFNFFNGENGLDLSNFDYFSVSVKYEKPIAQGIRFQVRNFNPDYSTLGDDLSLKYNVVEYVTLNNNYPVKIPLQSFQVPTWWLTSKKLTQINGVPEFSDVHTIDIVTGYTMPPGDYKIVIEEITLTGKWVRQDQLYLVLLVIWGGLGLYYWFTQSGMSRTLSRKTEVLTSKELTMLLKEKSMAADSERVASASAIDSKTSLPNYPLLAKQLNEFVSSKPSEKLSIVLADIEFPSNFNTNEREDILVSSASLIMLQIRKSDFIARWKESGFVIVFGKIDLAHATQITNKILTALTKEKSFYTKQCIASFGVAALNDEGLSSLISRADKALQNARIYQDHKVVAATTSMMELIREDQENND